MGEIWPKMGEMGEIWPKMGENGRNLTENDRKMSENE
jgi:hypothetical protein